MTFMDGTNFLGTGTLNNGVATFTTTSLTTGNHSITAVYINDGNYTSSTSPVLTQVISQASTTVTLNVPTGNPVSNQAMTLTAIVAAVSPATGTPSGTVNFFAGGTMIGSGTLTNGSTTFTFSGFALGNQALTAVYQGDSNFGAGTSSIAVPIKVGDGNQLWVNQIYIEMRHGIADPVGLANYSTLLANGFTRHYVTQQVASLSGLLRDSKLEKAVLGSAFSKHLRGAPLVTQIYQSILHRQPSAKELKSGVAQVRSGTHGANALIINLLSSDEFFHHAFAIGSTGAQAATG
jgi:hypothetical protein